MGKRGPESMYTPELAAEILERLVAGESLRRICVDEHMPSKGAVLLWVSDDREGFAARYDRARKLQAELLADELLDIADDGTNDYAETDRGVVSNLDHINRSRLRVDTRKWILSKMLPKFADKQQVEHSGALPVLVVRRETE